MARRGPASTADRLRRMLVMLPWLMERGEVPVAEVARQFGLSETEVVKELELVATCGLPPFIDELIDIWIDEGIVGVGIPRFFQRPLRLTAPEGFALLAAARVAMELPGADPEGALARALRKLATELGDVAVEVEVDAPPATADVTAAAADSARLRIVYASATAAAPSEREITPRRVFSDRGRWYVIADDHRTGEERTFRIDRIEQWQRTGVVDAPRDVPAPATDEWFADDDLPVARLHLGPAAAWVMERYPHRIVPDAASVDGAGGGTVVDLTVAHEGWLAELLLRLGPAATVMAPPEWVDLGARAAADVLRRYTDG